MTTITEAERQLRHCAVLSTDECAAILDELARTRAACALYHASLQAIGHRLGLAAGSDLTVECISAIDRLRAERDALKAEINRLCPSSWDENARAWAEELRKK